MKNESVQDESNLVTRVVREDFLPGGALELGNCGCSFTYNSELSRRGGWMSDHVLNLACKRGGKQDPVT